MPAAPPLSTGHEVADGESELQTRKQEAGQGRAGEGAIFYPQSASSIALSCSQVVVQGVDVVLKN